jgi:exosortase E/protease (VPEID-CTERM system)
VQPITREVSPPSSLRSQLAIAGGVLLAEYLLISLRFDSFTVVERGGLWALAGRMGAVAPLGAVIVTALLLRRREQRVTEALAPRPNYWLLGLHGLFFAGLFALTAVVFGGERPRGPAAIWLASWALVAAATAFSLLAGMVGREVLSRVASWSILLAGVTGVLAWLAGWFTTELWGALASATLTVATAMLRPFFPTIAYDAVESELALHDFAVTVSAVCSGLEGVGLISVLLVAYLFTFRDRLRFPNALLLLPIGIVAVWVGNAVRIATLMVVGAYVDPDLAHGGFHSKLGWILFCAVALGTVAVAQRLTFFSTEVEEAGPKENPTAAYLMPALALNGVALVSAMMAREMDWLYGLRLLAAGIMLYAYRSYYRDLPRAVSALPVVVGIAIGVGWLATAPPTPTISAQPSATWLVTRTLGSVLVVPLVEELAFRGCLMRWLISRDFTNVPFTKWTPWAVGASSLVFGLLHDRWIAATAVGVVYAALQLRRGRILDAVVAHAATNATVSAWVLWTGNWAHWS